MKNNHKFVLRQSALLFLTAVIWGVAFTAQSVGMDYVGPYTFNAARFLLGTLTLLPLVLIRRKTENGRSFHGGESLECAGSSGALEKGIAERGRGGKTYTGDHSNLPGTSPVYARSCPFWHRFPRSRVYLFTSGGLSGLALGAASNLQQMGILYTTVGKAGFITAMYIVLVPLFGIFIGRKLKLRIWLSVLAAAIGLYLLCMGAGEGLSAGKGEVLCLACAVLFAVQILLIDHFAPEDGVLFSALQFAVSCVFSSVLMLLFEHPSLELLLQAAGPILYAGILSCGVGYTLQVIGQKGMNPTIASLIMSLESTISAIAGFFLLHQSLSGREIWGCCIMGLAIVLAQL